MGAYSENSRVMLTKSNFRYGVLMALSSVESKNEKAQNFKQENIHNKW